MVRITKKILEEINNDPNGFALYTDIKLLVEIMTKFNEAYHSTDKPLVSDKVYDILYDILKDREPDNPFFKIIGAKVKMTTRMVKLPFPMGSLNKIKPDNDFLDKWLTKFKGPYVVSDKLDGISAQIYNDPKNGLKMYTRGEMTDEGNIGQDITEFIKYINCGDLKNIPSGTSIRGELIVSKTDFTNANSKYKNIRNAVGGIIGSKNKLDTEFAKLIKFISYAIIFPEFQQKTQMTKLESWKLNVVTYKVEKNLTEDYLKKYLIKRRTESDYNIDGIVVLDSSDNYKVPIGNPEYGFAFKMVLDDQFTIATVKDVIWEPTMNSYLKPVVEIVPVELVGTTVSRATAHNAKMVFDNKINKGSQIKIIRSGDVIPYIMDIIKPSKTPSTPSIPYKWNDSEVDYIIDYDKKVPKEIIDQVQIKLILYFFRTIGVKYLSEGIITKLYNEGYESIESIIGAPEEDLYNIDGLGKKSIDKIYKELYSKLDNLNLPLFMAASHMDRGLAERKIKEIIKKYPNIMTEKWSRTEFIDNIKEVDGFSDKLAERFVDSFKEFKKFYKEIDDVYDISYLLIDKKDKKDKKDSKKDKDEEDKFKDEFKGKSVCFTGFRDKEFEEFIENHGGKVSTSVSSKTSLLVHPDSDDKSSSKFKNAEKYETQTMTKSEFKKKYQL